MIPAPFRDRPVRAILAVGLLAFFTQGASVVPVSAQIQGADSGDHEHVAPVTRAARTSQPIIIDGVLDEPVWMTAPAISDFIQTVPDEGAPVTERTEVRFLYDDDNIYVGAWLWDEGEVLTRLARRDANVPDADFFVVLFDSYHDHRTAYRFATSPSGMKRDEIVTGGYGQGGGGFGDTSWDPIWEIRTSITDEGWFVEMRIPFSQLRYRSDDVQTWGLQVERKIRRKGEDTVWAFTPRNQPSGVNRYGHLEGIEGIQQGRRLELLPFVTGRAEYRDIPRSPGAGFDNPFRSGSDLFGNVGMDLKYRIGTNLTLDATVNPDFGQVELDPAVINLTAFETRYSENRPFFVEGAEIFRFGDGGGGGDAQLLYSRRIGRQPQGSVGNGAQYSDVPGAANILGAAKLTGKTADGWSVGILNALSDRAMAPWVDSEGDYFRTEVEPRTNHFAARVRRDLEGGTRAFGVIVTAVNRNLRTDALESRLRSSGQAAGIDGRIEWGNQAWGLSGRFAGSRVAGSASAIALTQRSSARYMARPDADHLDYDPEATSLEGYFGRLDLDRQSGTWQGGISLSATSPGFEVNDLGFQSAADRIDIGARFGYRQPRAGRHFRSLNLTASSRLLSNFGREALTKEVGLQLNATHMSQNGFNARVSRSFSSWDDRLTRGGPLTLSPAGYSANVGLNTDSRRFIQMRTGFQLSGDDGGASRRSGNLNMTMRFREIYEVQLGTNLSRTHTPAQWVPAQGSAGGASANRHVFAELDQTTFEVNARLNITFTPDLTFELYAQPFISSGDYGAIRELAAPRTFDFLTYGEDVGTIEREESGQYRISPTGDPEQYFFVSDRDFNFRSLIGNAVLRWEWRPGSTLYLVWQQNRAERLIAGAGDPEGTYGHFDLAGDSRALFSIHPDNTLMVKVTYWLNP
jgi:hypothetical protein